MNDAEARIREAENRLRALELFAQQARQRAVGQYQTALLLTQVGGYGAPQSNPLIITDPHCGVGIYSLMSLIDSQFGTWSLTWQYRGGGLIEPVPPAGLTSPVISSASGAWQGCQNVVIGGVSTPIMYTVFGPYASFPTSYSFFMDWINDGTGHGAAGACGGGFNAAGVQTPNRAIPNCSPWYAQLTQVMSLHSGAQTLTFQAP